MKCGVIESSAIDAQIGLVEFMDARTSLRSLSKIYQRNITPTSGAVVEARLRMLVDSIESAQEAPFLRRGLSIRQSQSWKVATFMKLRRRPPELLDEWQLCTISYQARARPREHTAFVQASSACQMTQ